MQAEHKGDGGSVMGTALMFFELVLKSTSFDAVYRRGSIDGSGDSNNSSQ